MSTYKRECPVKRYVHPVHTQVCGVDIIRLDIVSLGNGPVKCLVSFGWTLYILFMSGGTPLVVPDACPPWDNWNRLDIWPADPVDPTHTGSSCRNSRKRGVTAAFIFGWVTTGPIRSVTNCLPECLSKCLPECLIWNVLQEHSRWEVKLKVDTCLSERGKCLT